MAKARKFKVKVAVVCRVGNRTVTYQAGDLVRQKQVEPWVIQGGYAVEWDLEKNAEVPRPEPLEYEEDEDDEEPEPPKRSFETRAKLVSARTQASGAKEEADTPAKDK